MPKDFSNMIMNHLNTTTKQDTNHMILLTMLHHIDHIEHMTINQVADLCFVSPPTITRLAHSFDCKSFGEFKTCLKGLNSVIEYHHFHMQKQSYELLDKNPKLYLKEYAQSISQAVSDVSEDLDIDQIDRFLEKMQKADTVYIFGISSSYFNAKLLQTDLLMYKKICICPNSFEQQLEIANDVGPNDLVVFISCYGNILNQADGILRTLSKNGAYMTLITQNLHTVAATVFDEVISFTRTNHIDSGPFIMSIGCEYLCRRYSVLAHSTQPK